MLRLAVLNTMTRLLLLSPTNSRLFVESKIHNEFVERLAEKAKGRKIGDPLDPKTEQGPQVSKEQLDKILHYVKVGEKEGATLLTGGERVGSKGFFVNPQSSTT